MDKDKPQPQEKSIEPTKGYDPLLEEAPVQKEYQKPNISLENMPHDIPEVTFEKPEINFEKEQGESGIPNNETSEEKASFNPAMNDLSKKEKRIGAELMADTVLNGYDFLISNLISPIAKIKSAKIEEKILNKEINPTLKFVVDQDGTYADVREYVKGFNTAVDESLEVSNEFKESVREPLIRIAEKRGLAMTDEQYVGLAFGKDLLTKSVMVFQLKKSNSLIITMLEAETAKLSTQPDNTPTATKKEYSEVEKEEIRQAFKKDVVPQEEKPEEKADDLNFNNLHKKVVETTTKDNVKDNIAGFGNSELLNHMESEATKEIKSSTRTKRAKQTK